MKTSLLIPCHNKHTIFIPNLIDCLEASFAKPDEVLFSISEFRESNTLNDYGDRIKNLGIKIDFIRNKERKNAAENRNLLAKKSESEVLVFQDADDMFHPQRIEILKHFFLNFDVNHIAHSYSFTKERSLKQIIINKIKLESVNYLLLNKIYDSVFSDKFISHLMVGGYGSFNKKEDLIPQFPICNGAIAIKKEVFEEINWKTDKKTFLIAEDQDFNYEVFYNFNKSMLIFEELYYYNMSNSLNGGF